MAKRRIRWENLLILFLIACVIAYFVYPSVYEFLYPKEDKLDSVIAVVNGETIFNSKIIEAVSLFPPEYQAQVNRDFILNQTINEILLMQYADELNISVSDEDYNEHLEMFLNESNINMSEFELVLEINNISKEEFKKDFTEKIKLDIVLNDYVLAKIYVSDDEIKEFYDNNTELFMNQSFDEVEDFLRDNILGIARIKEFNKVMNIMQSEANIRDYRYENACNSKEIFYYAEEDVDNNDVIFVKKSDKDLVNFCFNIEKSPVVICGDKLFEVDSEKEVNFSVSLCE